MRKIGLLVPIVILAFAVRFYRLGQNPPSLNLDEVAIGHNSYSILKTGMDEYGKRLPLVFRSHDDYKPPLYIYLTVPSIAILGLTPFAVRLPSALAGTITVLLTYFLVKELFSIRPTDHLQPGTRHPAPGTLAALTALLLAISPWHIQYSRAAFETNLAVLFTVTGVWAFLKGLTSTRWWYVSAASFALSLYTYHVSRVFVPLFSLIVATTFFASVRKKMRENLGAALLFVFLALPLVPVLTSTAGQMRFKGTSVFENAKIFNEEEKRSLSDWREGSPWIAKIVHHPAIAASTLVVEGYFKHLRPDFLFLGRNGPPVNYSPNVGPLFLVDLPFLLLGIVTVVRNLPKEKTILLFSWLLLSPLASAFTRDVPSATRMTIALPIFQILVAAGIAKYFPRRKQRPQILGRLKILAVISLYVLSAEYFLHQYFIHAPIEYSESWQYGYKEAVLFAEQHKAEYDRILVSTNLKQPQNFFAFYTAYDPWTYIFVDGGTVSGGFSETKNKFDKFEFHPIDYGKLDPTQQFLLIDRFEKMPQEYKSKAVKIISLPTGEPEIIISKT